MFVPHETYVVYSVTRCFSTEQAFACYLGKALLSVHHSTWIQWSVEKIWFPWKLNLQKCFVGASLSKPHTSVTALRDVCVCMSVCSHIPKIKFNEQKQRHLKFAHVLLKFMQVDTMDPSLSNSTPMDLLIVRDRLRLEQEERLLLDCSVGAKETRSKDQSRPR